MANRGQTQARIDTVSRSLQGLSKALVPIDRFNTNLPIDTDNQKIFTKGKRL
jgi:hypothetical protein